MKLTPTLRVILQAVVLQANRPVGEIARAVKMREHVVRRGINSLIEQGIFLRRSVWVDPHRLGLTLHIVHVELPLRAIKHRERVLAQLVSNDQVCSVAELGGGGLFEVRVLARGPEQLSGVFEQIASALSVPINIRSYLTVTEQEYSGTSEPGNSSSAGGSLRFGSMPSGTIPRSLDEKDHEILSALANQSYMNFQQVGRTLKIPPATLLYRVEKLEQVGIISGHYYVMDPKVYREIPMALHLKSRLLTANEKAALARYCKSHPHISLLSFLFGDYTAEMYLLAQDQEEIQVIVRDMSSRFEGVFDSISISPQLSFAKFSLYPFKSFEAYKVAALKG